LIQPKKARRPVQVLVYLARKTDNGWEFLLMRRVPGRGGFWQGVSGGAEEGEGLLEAAKREISEETGFDLKTIEAIGYSYTFPVDDEWKHVYAPEVSYIEEHVFVALVDGGEPKLSDEHNAWRWVSFETGSDLLKWPENKEALRRCCDFLRRQARDVV
jgi:dihydroneopterin triphosphate diphosphatase